MWYGLDFEFNERASGCIEPISVGLVCEDGRGLYRQSNQFDPHALTPWLWEHVVPQLAPCPIRVPQATVQSPYQTGARRLEVHAPRCVDANCAWWSIPQIAQAIFEFVGDDPQPVFWGYYADYDWVILCQMFGSMLALPKGWPMYCRDIKQWCDMLGNPRLPEQTTGEHHSLWDARWVRAAWQFLRAYERQYGVPDVDAVARRA